MDLQKKYSLLALNLRIICPLPIKIPKQLNRLALFKILCTKLFFCIEPGIMIYIPDIFFGCPFFIPVDRKNSRFKSDKKSKEIKL
jgi:hypothetical protein